MSKNIVNFHLRAANENEMQGTQEKPSGTRGAGFLECEFAGQSLYVPIASKKKRKFPSPVGKAQEYQELYNAWQNACISTDYKCGRLNSEGARVMPPPERLPEDTAKIEGLETALRSFKPAMAYPEAKPIEPV